MPQRRWDGLDVHPQIGRGLFPIRGGRGYVKRADCDPSFQRRSGAGGLERSFDGGNDGGHVRWRDEYAVDEDAGRSTDVEGEGVVDVLLDGSQMTTASEAVVECIAIQAEERGDITQHGVGEAAFVEATLVGVEQTRKTLEGSLLRRALRGLSGARGLWAQERIVAGDEPDLSGFDVLFQQDRFHRTGELSAVRSLEIVERCHGDCGVGVPDGVAIRCERRLAATTGGGER